MECGIWKHGMRYVKRNGEWEWECGIRNKVEVKVVNINIRTFKCQDVDGIIQV